MRFESALVVFAHPDDAEFMSAGTIAAWAEEGTEVHYVCVTDGSAGSNEPGMSRERLREVREAEQRAACEVLGVKSVAFLGWLDGSVEVTMDLRRAVTREVRRRRPEVLMGPDPSRLWSGRRYINHRDHRMVGEAVLSAVMPDAPTRPQFPELLEEGLEPFEVPNLWLSAMDEGDGFVDIVATIEKKLDALACHASQHDNEGEMREQVRGWAKAVGERAGLEYAEAFRTFAFRD